VSLTVSALLYGGSCAHRVLSLVDGESHWGATSLEGAFSSSIEENAIAVRSTNDRFGARTSHGIDSLRALIGLPDFAALVCEPLPFLVEESGAVDKSVRNSVDAAVDGSWTIRRPDLSTPLLHAAHQIPTKSDPCGEVHKGVTSTGLTD
jgi:hypothetical protein